MWTQSRDERILRYATLQMNPATRFLDDGFHWYVPNMTIALDTGAKRLGLFAAAVVLSGIYLTFCTRVFLAQYDCTRHDLQHLQAAIRLMPWDADYHLQLARYLFQDGKNMRASELEYEAAARLDPNRARTWLGLGEVRQVLGDAQGARDAFEQALDADPATPKVMWRVGEFFLTQGETERASNEFKSVVTSEPGSTPAMLRLVSRTTDTGTIIHDALPAEPGAYFDFIDLLIEKRDTASAVKVWDALAELGKPLEARRAYEYINYLIAQREVGEARSAWHTLALLSGLSSYLSSEHNRIVNPGFELEILNNGFDWRYQNERDVTLTLERMRDHSAQNALAVSFEGPGVSDAGILQLIPVQSGTEYEFSASYKNGVIDGAGGPRFDISDAYTGTTYFQSGDLRDASDWRRCTAQFTTGRETQLLALRIARVPAGSPIRGKLWVADFHLAQK